VIHRRLTAVALGLSTLLCMGHPALARSRVRAVAGQGATEWDNLDYGPFLSLRSKRAPLPGT